MPMPAHHLYKDKLVIYGETMPFINNHDPRELRNICILFTVYAGASA